MGQLSVPGGFVGVTVGAIGCDCVCVCVRERERDRESTTSGRLQGETTEHVKRRRAATESKTAAGDRLASPVLILPHVDAKSIFLFKS